MTLYGMECNYPPRLASVSSCCSRFGGRGGLARKLLLGMASRNGEPVFFLEFPKLNFFRRASRAEKNLKQPIVFGRFSKIYFFRSQNFQKYGNFKNFQTFLKNFQTSPHPKSHVEKFNSGVGKTLHSVTTCNYMILLSNYPLPPLALRMRELSTPGEPVPSGTGLQRHCVYEACELLMVGDIGTGLAE